MTAQAVLSRDEAIKQPADGLKESWTQMRREQPRLRIRNAAELLGVSELALLLTQMEQRVQPLGGDFAEMLTSIESVGRVMALTRNDQAVHERHGVYHDFKANAAGVMGLCLGEIDLRVFFKHWRHAYAVTEGADEQPRRSIQFFDASGTATHKIYATEHTDMAAWDQWINAHLAVDAELFFMPEAKTPPLYPNAGNVTEDEVRRPWSELKDVHHFNAMLSKLGIDRLEALQMAGQEYAHRLPTDAMEQALRFAANCQLEIMAFVGNDGVVQIHTGTVNKLLRAGPWFNVLDPDFNLHLNTEQLASCWAVRRPTSDGVVTSLECFNHERKLVLTLFGARKPGKPELTEWRELVASVENLS
ncbi:hemin-degrading factor [Hahella sp. NBU794]|uniref:hemin-degrading factor n=1 Tax=Hahella sp. NBU794 TaxID=3422590 RepID=UPI003D6E8121